MNQKSLLFYATLFACFLLFAQTLKINHFESDFKRKMNHKFSNIFHLQDDVQTPQDGSDSEVTLPDGFASELFTYVLSDETLTTKAMNGEQLSQDEAEKLKGFVGQSQGFQSMVQSQIGQDDCFESLTDDQRQRIINIVLDQMDFTKIFTGSEESQLELDDSKLMTAFAADPELATAISQCNPSVESQNHRQEDSQSSSEDSEEVQVSHLRSQKAHRH